MHFESKPSDELGRILDGDMNLVDAEDAVRSWAQIYVYQHATRIIAINGKGNRNKALSDTPSTIRNAVREEAIRLWRYRARERARRISQK